MKKNLLKSMYNIQITEREISRRQVHLNASSQQLPPSAIPSDQTVPSLDELDEIDLDMVCFEDFIDNDNTVLSDNIDPLPLSFNPDDLLDFTPEDIACLFD